MRIKAALFVAAVMASLTVQPSQAAAGSTEYCKQYATIDVANGRYVVDNNNYGTKAGDQCVSTDGGANFAVASSNAAADPAKGGPVSYPEIFDGCHWGRCSTTTKLPAPVALIGRSVSSWSTTLPATGTYNLSYDLWFHPSKTTTATNGQPTGAELMIWLTKSPSLPGPKITGEATVGGRKYGTWEMPITANGQTWPLIGYQLETPTTSVSNLDLRAFIRDAVVRGVVKPNWYLMSVEAGFEVWSGGAGLKTDSFSASTTLGFPVGPVRSSISGYCMNNADDRIENGNPVVLGACDGQKWSVAIDGTIRHGGLCLGTTKEFVSLSTCNGSEYQRWLQARDSGLWNVGAKLCMRAPEGKSGVRLDLHDCDGRAADQKWTLPTTLAAKPA